ncbi:MAG TPA: helix-turn-helix domain-containing protein [Kofleriaceae bacterium]|jgi:AraC-like DNA-binding protein
MSAIAALLVHECDRDRDLVSIPRAEIQVVVRMGAVARGGLDIHALGAHQTIRRKRIRGGQRTIMARLGLDRAEAVLGVPAATLAGRVVPLDQLWGDAETRRLVDRLGSTRTAITAAAILERAIETRAPAANANAHARLVLAAAERLAHANVTDVADELGVSERHLRRVFRDVTGVSPKAFARLARFHRALSAGRAAQRASWARIAVATGYYDQAHLIDEFRAIAGTTPRGLVDEILEPTAI